MIVLDASVAVGAALGLPGVLTELARHDLLVAPHLIDPEVLNTLRGRVLGGKLSEPVALLAVRNWQSIALQRQPIHDLSSRIWELRHNVTVYDAAYVTLAEAYDCPLLTADGRLAAASGPRCSITVLRNAAPSR